MKKSISVLLAALLCCGCLFCAFAAQDDGLHITNPYAGVDWDTVQQYKAALHSHTNASDGSMTLAQSVARHLETGFDIVAVTDHGTVDYSWIEGPQDGLIKTALSLLGRSDGDIEYLGVSGTFPDGTGYTVRNTANTDQYLFADNGRVILKMPYGIENNAVSVNAHVNSWFVDYHDNTVTTYEDAVKAVDFAGGLCVINHPGEYTKARYEIRSADAYDESVPSYAYYINKYSDLLQKYDACLGIDVNSKGDGRTRFDRKLWDILLTRFSAAGENVFGICSSDAHQLDKIDTGFTLLLMNGLSSNGVRLALEHGCFFGASHCLGNYEELLEIADALKAFYGENNAVYRNVRAVTDAMAEKIEGIETGVYGADEDIGITYSVLDSAGYTAVDTFPAVTRIRVDDAQNVIAVDTRDALLVRFISGGRQIAVTTPENAEIDLDDYADLPGDYVRVEVFGEGGMLYTQAFLLNAAENAGQGGTVSGTYADLGFMDFLLAVLHNWRQIIMRFASNLLR